MQHVTQLVIGLVTTEQAEEIVCKLVQRHSVAKEVHCADEKLILV